MGPFSNAQRKQCFCVEITDDMTHEDSEHFFLNLTTHPKELQGVTIDLDVAEVTINDNDCKCNYHTVDFCVWFEINWFVCFLLHLQK